MISIIILFSLISLSYSADVDITAGPPPYDKPWVPGWGYFGDPNGWKHRHEHMLNQTHDNKEKIKIVFFGDSKTEGWAGNGKEIWNEYYAKRGAYNYGIGGDSTRQLLWRMDNGELDGLTPKVLVLMIGGNNLHNDYNRGTDEEIVKAIHVIIEKIRQKLAQTKIILIGQIPRGSKSEDDRVKDIDKLLKKDFPVDTEWVYYLDISEKYRDSTTELQNKSLYVSDGVHMNKDGYKIWAESMEPVLKKLLEN